MTADNALNVDATYGPTLMHSLRNIDAFYELKGRLIADSDRRTPVIVIPAGTCGQASGANDLIRATKRELLTHGLAERVRLRITGCHGFCEMEPSLLIEPGGTFYPRVDPKDIPRIVAAVDQNRVLEDLLYKNDTTGDVIEKQSDIPFFRYQVRTIISRNETLDPIRLYNYIIQSGYQALVSTLERGDPAWVISQVKDSGLRGRGGAGFPTGVKWEMLATARNGTSKYLVCNADEGDPGAYMDRSILEGNPHSIIEGMLIGAYATGAGRGVVYVRDEYPLALKHLIIAVRRAGQLGLLGQNILDTGFSFDLQIVKGAGAFVCGEETALMRSVEGAMGEPRQRPPFPVERGINGKPTAINNVETWANIPIILQRGANSYAEVGTKGNTGTKVFSLVGKVKNTGLVEVPMGTPLHTLIYDIGGGASTCAPIKGVQTGGPSGGCIPSELFHLPIDYDSLSKAGSIMGSGGMIIIDEKTCMVDVAKYFMAFLKDESCGKCFTCRKGTQRMHELLDDITQGKGTHADLSLLQELSEVVRDTTMCGLGQTASNPVLSTLRYFRNEYLEHIDGLRCPAGVCKALITYAMNELCNGCGACVKPCPEGAITGQKNHRHEIDPERCIKCGACRSVCKFDAIEVH